MAKSSRLVSGMLFGAAVGVIAGLLLAPKPGKETRKVVVTRSGALRQKTGEYVGTLRRRMRGRRGAKAVEESSDQHAGISG